MSLGGELAEGQAQASSTSARGATRSFELDEGIEYLVAQLRGEPLTCVPNSKLDGARDQRALDSNHRFGRGVANGVLDQVGQHPAEQVFVRGDLVALESDS